MRDNLTRYVAFALMIGVLSGVVAAIYLFNKPAATVVSGEADYKIDADKLFDDFSSNEGKANEKYLNKVLQVAGKIAQITTQHGLGNTVTLETSGMFGVSCELPIEEDISKYNEGDSIVLKGLCTGILMDVVLVRCTVAKNESEKIVMN